MGQSEWNAGTSSVGDVWSSLGTVAGELKWPIFGLYVVGFLLVCIAISVVFAASQPVAGLLLSGEDVNWPLLVVGWGGAWLISGTVFFGLLGTGRRALLEGDHPGGLFATCGDFLRPTPKVFVAVLLVTIAQCMVICLPGLVILALSPILYLTAAWPDASWRRRVSTGSHWLKVHALTLATLLALSYWFNGFLWGGLYAFGILGYSATPYIFGSTLGLGFVGAGVLVAAVVIHVAYFVATVSTFVAMEREAEG
jgi:hypothetical protein